MAPDSVTLPVYSINYCENHNYLSNNYGLTEHSAINAVTPLSLTKYFSLLNNNLNESEEKSVLPAFFDQNNIISAFYFQIFYFPACKTTNSYAH